LGDFWNTIEADGYTWSQNETGLPRCQLRAPVLRMEVNGLSQSHHKFKYDYTFSGGLVLRDEFGDVFETFCVDSVLDEEGEHAGTAAAFCEPTRR